MDLITHIEGVANFGQFNPGPNTPAPWNIRHVGAVDGHTPDTSTRNMAEIYNRLCLQIAAAIEASGLVIDNNNWAQLAQAMTRMGGLSKDPGNLLQKRADGLYYGVVAPADISNLFVDGVDGDDSAAGTRVAPLKTVRAALARGPQGVTRTINLHEDQDHVLDTASPAILRGGLLIVQPYGPMADAMPLKSGDSKFATAASWDLNTNLVCTPSFVYESLGVEYQRCMGLYPTYAGIIRATGIGLRAAPLSNGTAYKVRGSFFEQASEGGWFAYFCRIELPDADSQFEGGSVVSHSMQLQQTTISGAGVLTPGGSALTSLQYLPGGSGTPAAIVADKYIASRDVRTRVYGGLRTNIEPPAAV